MNVTKLEHSDLNAIILAGGEGTRLASLTRTISGEEIPKQFCRLFEGTTLLDQTRRRVSIAVSSDRTLIVLNSQHKRFYKPLLSTTDQRNLVVQPRNRGTAPAILYALFRLIHQGRRGTVAIFPCDPYVSDDRRFMLHVQVASCVADKFPRRLVLLGIPADAPESQYGWIEPANPINLRDAGPVFHIRRFWEKPSPDIAVELLKQGFLWNSFVILARITALLDLFARVLPHLYIPFAQSLSFFQTTAEWPIIDRLYDNIASISFSDKILTEVSEELLVLPVRDVQWNDLGEPTRVLNTIVQLGLHPKWLAT
jgi:mannose-1-phosphate guanylyltransferase